ncbi:MAG: hypothetical protein K2W92_07810 [Alphaproteobacteria bacterium]|nr:hypothetical protein [Alphaproteobacteria bacterium]
MSGENKCASLNNSLLLSSRNLGTLREHWRALGFLNVRDDKRGDSFQVLPLAGFFIALVSTHLFHALLIFPRTLVRLHGNFRN